MGTVEEKELSGTVVSSARSSLLKMKLLASVVVVVVMAGCVFGMDVGKGGVYDSPMAQDYYVKRFGFMFGGGRSGMYGLKAFQADGLVAQKKEVKPAVQMRNRWTPTTGTSFQPPPPPPTPSTGSGASP